MFRITKNPSSGSLTHYLAKTTRMALSCPLTPYRKAQAPSYTVNYTHAPRAEYAAITPTTSMSTDTIELFM